MSVTQRSAIRLQLINYSTHHAATTTTILAVCTKAAHIIQAYRSALQQAQHSQAFASPTDTLSRMYLLQSDKKASCQPAGWQHNQRCAMVRSTVQPKHPHSTVDGQAASTAHHALLLCGREGARPAYRMQGASIVQHTKVTLVCGTTLAP